MLTINPGENIFMNKNIKEGSIITNVAEKELNLLSRHINVLKTVEEHGPIGIIRLSQMTGQPQHMIRYSLRTLEKDGVISPSPKGAVVTDRVADVLGTLELALDDFSSTVKDLKTKLKKE